MLSREENWPQVNFNAWMHVETSHLDLVPFTVEKHSCFRVSGKDFLGPVFGKSSDYVILECIVDKEL